ncbi:hypothetical protein B0T14DRAFT_570123 [Immersiella caudata]|uniref:Uncharacterized protein n=1 Tax=Immersiella caudata TaxID=314043 RepID=A0AA39WEX4_9PEZI|nr:hypothetical protein B0T14DRAFT_570123 [Immersiella caudata]
MSQQRLNHPPPDQSYLHPPSSSTYSMDTDIPALQATTMAFSPAPPKLLSQRPFITTDLPTTASSTTATTCTSTLLHKPAPPPPPPPPTTQTQTRYITMLVSLSQITRLHNILACFFTYLLLIGFVIIPGAFTPAPVPPPKGKTPPPPKPLSASEKGITASGFGCIIAAVLGVVWLEIRWRGNYVWVINKIYVPLVLNAVVGMVATIVVVVMAEGGYWSGAAQAAVGIQAMIVAVAGGLFVWYKFVLLRRLREEHKSFRNANVPATVIIITTISSSPSTPTIPHLPSSTPASNTSTPSTAPGKASSNPLSPFPNIIPITTFTTPKTMTLAPLLAPNFHCAANPPAPWQTGIPFTHPTHTFIRPTETPSAVVLGGATSGASLSDNEDTASMEFNNVSGSCDTAISTAGRIVTGSLTNGEVKCGVQREKEGVWDGRIKGREEMRRRRAEGKRGETRGRRRRGTARRI